MRKKFGETEKKLEALFKEGTVFAFKGEKLKINFVGKPTTAKGECKTDLYICAENKKGKKIEIKISIKQANADFLENKMKLSRAIEIFGKNAQRIISNAIVAIKENFEEENLVFFKKKGNIEIYSMTLGWKFEFFNKKAGKKAGLIELTEDQKIDVLSGTNLSEDKKNCHVNGQLVENSGIANYILITEGEINKDVDYYASDLISVMDYARHIEIYFACKAINYRTIPNKWDSNRPLAVYVEWTLKNQKLSANLIYNRPLELHADEIGEHVQGILKKLKINRDNFEKLKKHLNENVKIYH